jgi:hypothetical protein
VEVRGGAADVPRPLAARTSAVVDKSSTVIDFRLVGFPPFGKIAETGLVVYLLRSGRLSHIAPVPSVELSTAVDRSRRNRVD